MARNQIICSTHFQIKLIKFSYNGPGSAAVIYVDGDSARRAHETLKDVTIGNQKLVTTLAHDVKSPKTYFIHA